MASKDGKKRVFARDDSELFLKSTLPPRNILRSSGGFDLEKDRLNIKEDDIVSFRHTTSLPKQRKKVKSKTINNAQIKDYFRSFSPANEIPFFNTREVRNIQTRNQKKSVSKLFPDEESEDVSNNSVNNQNSTKEKKKNGNEITDSENTEKNHGEDKEKEKQKSNEKQKPKSEKVRRKKNNASDPVITSSRKDEENSTGLRKRSKGKINEETKENNAEKTKSKEKKTKDEKIEEKLKLKIKSDEEGEEEEEVARVIEKSPSSPAPSENILSAQPDTLHPKVTKKKSASVGRQKQKESFYQSYHHSVYDGIEELSSDLSSPFSKKKKSNTAKKLEKREVPQISNLLSLFQPLSPRSALQKLNQTTPPEKNSSNDCDVDFSSDKKVEGNNQNDSFAHGMEKRASAIGIEFSRMKATEKLVIGNNRQSFTIQRDHCRDELSFPDLPPLPNPPPQIALNDLPLENKNSLSSIARKKKKKSKNKTLDGDIKSLEAALIKKTKTVHKLAVSPRKSKKLDEKLREKQRRKQSAFVPDLGDVEKKKDKKPKGDKGLVNLKHSRTNIELYKYGSDIDDDDDDDDEDSSDDIQQTKEDLRALAANLHSKDKSTLKRKKKHHNSNHHRDDAKNKEIANGEVGSSDDESSLSLPLSGGLNSATEDEFRSPRIIRTARIDKARKAETEKELSLAVGDLVIVKSNPHLGWCLGEYNSKLGYFPVSLSSDLSNDFSSLLTGQISDKIPSSFPFEEPTNSFEHLPLDDSEQEKEKGLVEQTAVKLFTTKPERAISMLTGSGILEKTPQAIGNYLFYKSELDKGMVGEYLGSPDDFQQECLTAYLDNFNFKDVQFDQAIRIFLFSFKLPGEAQKISRILERFAQKYYTDYNGSVFESQDTVFILAFSIIMLNTDLHSASVKKKMTMAEFVNNNRGINNGKSLPRVYLEDLYQRISEDEIKTKSILLYPKAVKFGYLFMEKKANLIGRPSMKRYWFVLDRFSKQLLVFKLETDTTPTESYKLENLSIKCNKIDKKDVMFPIILNYKDDDGKAIEIKLFTQSQRLWVDWITAINDTIRDISS